MHLPERLSDDSPLLIPCCAVLLPAFLGMFLAVCSSQLFGFRQNSSAFLIPPWSRPRGVGCDRGSVFDGGGDGFDYFFDIFVKACDCSWSLQRGERVSEGSLESGFVDCFPVSALLRWQLCHPEAEGSDDGEVV